MAISITGRVIKVKQKSLLKTHKRMQSKKFLEYNHLRIQFADDSEIHLLLTDKQVFKAIIKAKENGLNGAVTWIYELWLDGIVSICKEDKMQDIRRYGLPRLARKFSHVRVNLSGKIIHLALENKSLKNAIKRAESFKEDLPKFSWLSDNFIGGYYEKTKKWQGTSANIS